MKKNVLYILLCCMIYTLSHTAAQEPAKQQADASQQEDTLYFEQWASVPLKFCATLQQKMEALKARAMVFAIGYPAEKRDIIKRQLQDNEQKKTFELPALKHPDAPVDPRTVARIMFALKQQEAPAQSAEAASSSTSSSSARSNNQSASDQ